ncbi:MAG TPA: uracil-DNA glycosylase family protein [Puia sp.]
MNTLLNKIKLCEICKDHLPSQPRPVVQLSPYSKIIMISQAPSKRVHETGIPGNDASGKKLREWLNVDEATFYDPNYFSLVPVGFCYPGKGISGDLPPRPECAPIWHPKILNSFKSVPLIILVGQFAQRYYLKKECKGSLTETVKSYKEYLPKYFPLPHPSPRNQNWVKINSWFTEEVIPELRKRIKSVICKVKKSDAC